MFAHPFAPLILKENEAGFATTPPHSWSVAVPPRFPREQTKSLRFPREQNRATIF